MQTVKVRDSVRSDYNSFTVDDERAFAEPQGGLCNEWVSIRPVVATARQQTHALALALNNQAITIMLDLVNPIGPRRHFGAGCRDAGLIRKRTQHGPNNQIPGTRPQIAPGPAVPTAGVHPASNELLISRAQLRRTHG